MRSTIIGLFCYLLACLPVRSQPAYLDRINELVASYAKQELFSGSVLVASDGEAFVMGYGLANRTWNIKNTPQTRFQIASLTKSFTAALILQLEEQGRLSLDDPLTMYLPDYPGDYGADISIRNLLNHTSGIPDYTTFSSWQNSTSRIDVRPTGFVNYIAEKELEFDPGSQFSYSNSNYYLLGVVIEKLTARSYGRVLQEQILDPGGLDNTGYRFDRMVVEQMAEGYERLPNGFYEKAPYQSPSTAYSASGMYSTVEDLYRWDQLLNSDRLLAGSYRDEMVTPGRGNYGYGWVIGRIHPNQATQFFKSPFTFTPDGRTGSGTGYKVIWHWGNNPGFNTLLVRVPEPRWTIIMLENQELLGDSERTNLFDIAGSIIKVLEEQQ